jgi:hypothetical protein
LNKPINPHSAFRIPYSPLSTPVPKIILP